MLWEQQFNSLTTQRENLEKKIAAMSAWLGETTGPLRISAVQSMLPPETAFLGFIEYEHPSADPSQKDGVARPRHYLAMLIRPDRDPVVIQLENTDTINELITSYRQFLITARPIGGGQDLGDLLREHVWTPVERHLDGITTVIISPDTALGTLPWGAIPGKELGTYLLEDYRLAMVPFANMLPSILMDGRKSRGTGVLIMGDIDYDAIPNAKHDLTTSIQNREGSPPSTLRGQTDHKWTPLKGFSEEVRIVQSLYHHRFGEDAAGFEADWGGGHGKSFA